MAVSTSVKELADSIITYLAERNRKFPSVTSGRAKGQSILEKNPTRPRHASAKKQALMNRNLDGQAHLGQRKDMGAIWRRGDYVFRRPELRWWLSFLAWAENYTQEDFILGYVGFGAPASLISLQAARRRCFSNARHDDARRRSVAARSGRRT